MKTNFLVSLVLFALGFNAVAVQEKAPTATNQDAVLPLIAMDQVPLRDAVKNLTRQMSQRNYIFDPRVIASFAGPTGAAANEPNVKGRWEKVTAEQALVAILAEHKLKLVRNPATTVARIVPADDTAKVATFSFLSDKDPIMPSVMMTDVPFSEVIIALARQGQMLPISLDPQLDAAGSAPGGKALSQAPVTYRWEKLSVKQALAAVLENYGLILLPAEGASPAKITKAPVAK